MAHTRHKINIVMAGTAGFHTGFFDYLERLWGGLIVRIMTGQAVAWILRMNHIGKIAGRVTKPPENVVFATLNAGQPLPHMDLMNHLAKIQGVATLGINASRVVAGHAVIDIDPTATVQCQVIPVTAAAGFLGNNFTMINILFRGQTGRGLKGIHRIGRG